MNALNFIAGEFTTAREGGTFPHVDPSTGRPDCDVADSGLLDVVSAIQAANKVTATWSKTTPEERASYLEKIATLVEERRDPLAEAQSRDQGTLLSFAKSWSIPRAADVIRHHARLAVAEEADVVPDDGFRFKSNRLPIGVVGIITPWVDPIAILASRVSAALASGNAVICKVSEFAPRSGQAFAEIVRDAGLPAGVFNLLQGRGVTVGRSLVEHPGLSTLSFTGSTETGRSINVLASESLKRLHLALGARNPVMVFAGCDLTKVVPQVADVVLGTHPRQCWRGSRLFIQDPIYKDFLAAFKEHVEKKRIGPAQNPESEIGPLAHTGLARRFEDVAAQATREKGKWLFGGAATHANGAFVTPSATFDFTLCSTLQQDEIIGPMMTIASFKYQHDAVKQANNSPLGQVAYVFENDPEKAAKIAAKIEAGRVFVNTSEPRDSLLVSTGGVKLSGQGRENSAELINFFSRRSTIAF